MLFRHHKIVLVFTFLVATSFVRQAATASNSLEAATPSPSSIIQLPSLQNLQERVSYFSDKLHLYELRLANETDPTPVIMNLLRMVKPYCAADEFHNVVVELADYYNVDVQSNDNQIQIKNINSFSKTTSTESILSADRLISSTATNGNGISPSVVASTINNRLFTVWQDERNGDADPDIFGQFLDTSLNPVGSNFRVNSGGTGSAQINPKVAALSDGGYVVVWEDFRSSRSTVFLRRFDQNGQALGNDLKVDVSQTKPQSMPAVTADGVGHYFVTWVAERNSDIEIYARRFTNDGSAEGNSFLINDDGQNKIQWSPAISANQSGATLIVWEDKRNGNSDIYGQRIRPDGSKRASNFRIDNDALKKLQWKPTVSSAPAGYFVVGWEDYRNGKAGVFGQWYTVDLLSEGTNVQVDNNSSTANHYSPNVTVLQDGGCIFSWQDNRDGAWNVYAQVFRSDRNTWQSNFLVNENLPSIDQVLPWATSLGNFSYIVWQDERNGDGKWEVYANSFDWNTVPVELASFEGRSVEEGVLLNWQTASETNNFGFVVQKSVDRQSYHEVVFIKGHGTTSEPKSYEYLDRFDLQGDFYYRLQQIDFDGLISLSKVIRVSHVVMQKFALEQCFPNPFNPSTVINYSIPQDGWVDLMVYDVLGNQVRHLVNEYQTVGHHHIAWNGRNDYGQNVGSGVYIALLRSNGLVESKRLILAR